MQHAMTPIVRKKTAHIGCAGHIFSVRPSNQAPVPITLANRDALRVLMKSAPGATAVVPANAARVPALSRRLRAAAEICGKFDPPMKEAGISAEFEVPRD